MSGGFQNLSTVSCAKSFNLGKKAVCVLGDSEPPCAQPWGANGICPVGPSTQSQQGKTSLDIVKCSWGQIALC